MPDTRPSQIPRRALLRFITSIVALVPAYGYFVHASRDSPAVALLIFAAWALSCVLALVATLRAVVRPSRSLRRRRTIAIRGLYLWAAGILGWGGVRKAFFELIAG